MVKDEQHQTAELVNANNLNETNIARIKALETQVAELIAERDNLLERNANLEYIMADMPCNIFWLNLKGEYQYCNNQQAYYLNFKNRDEIIGKTNYDLFPPENAILIEENNKKVIDAGEPITFEEIGICKSDGVARIFLSSKAPVKNKNGNVIGIFGMGLDITDRKKMEAELDIAKAKAEIASKAKSEFIANMSHDLRTPFSGILGFAYHLYEEEIEPQKKEKVGYILQSSEKLLNLLNEILQNTKDGEQQQFILSDFDLIKLIDDIKMLFTAEIERKKLKFEFHCSYQNLIIHNDKNRLHRSIINLLSNAIKFTDKGIVSITLDVYKKNDEEFIEIKISDTGIGIPEESFNTIFERFTRLSSSYEGIYFGTGVGLWLTKKFINDLGGSIEVSSILGQGSTFTCYLPVKIMQRIHHHEFAQSLHLPDNLKQYDVHTVRYLDTTQRNNQPMRILMVEDDEMCLVMQSIILTDLNYVVENAGTWQKAIELASQKAFDLILLDIGLPGVTGFELANKIKRECSLNKSTPIVGITAHVTQLEIALCEGSAIDKLMLKPLTRSLCMQFPYWFPKRQC